MEDVVWWLHVQTVQSYVGVSCVLVETFLIYCLYLGCNFNNIDNFVT